jgi:hypothetical protein
MNQFTDPLAAQEAIAQAAFNRAQKQQQEFNVPQGTMAGQVYVPSSPLQHLGELLRQKGAMNQEKKAMQELQGIGQQRQEAQGRDMSAFVQALRGTPANAPQPDYEGNAVGPTMPAKAGNPYEAYAQAAASQSPMVRQMGMTGMAQLPQMEAAKAEKEANRAWQAEQKGLDRQAREDTMRMQLEGQRQLRELTAGQRQAQIIDTDQGKMRVMPNGQLAPLMDMSGNAISGPKGPQGTLAQQKEAQQALAAIKQAEGILPNATSSGLGNAVDATAAFFGQSTTGAQNAAKLKAIEGDLVSKMPKMSGPQSDKDVAMYKQMAGVVGDATQPVATRQAALAEVKKIQERYAGPQVNLGATGNPNSVMSNSGGGGRIRFDAQGNIIP